MTGRDKINIMTSKLLKVYHNTGKIYVIHLIANTTLRNIIVLAKDAGQIAIAKEYGARSAITG